MILADYNAVSRGLDSIAQRRQADEQMQLQRDALRRRFEQEETETQLRRDALRFQEEQATLGAADRLTAREQAKQRLEMEVQAQAWNFNPQNPANQMRTAQQGLVTAQAAAIASKPQSPLAATTQGIEEFSDAMAAAVQENQQAMTFVQANPGNLEAQHRVTKAQLKLSGLQEFSKTMLSKWKPQNEPEVDIELPGPLGEDGTPSGKLRMKVPQSQWNEQHPMWGKFNAPKAAPSPVAGADGIPTLTPQQAQAAKPGTKFRTIDGRILVR